ncbi:MAG: multicopper oxidase family protein [Proteobacteria bacterium]|nr:multicopper oxidase family protein [Pseudomonadota bacterium]
MRGWHPSRRELLLTLAASAVGTATHAQEASTPATLRARKVKRQVLAPDGPPTELWELTVDGSLPVLRARQGVEFHLQISNELDVELWLHFHGVRGGYEAMTVQVPAHTTSPVDVRFTPPDAGTFLILPLLNASRQRDMGLQALLIVEEAEPPANFNDVPLVFDDWIIGDDGKLDENFGDLNAAIAEGRQGNWFTVNGAFKPRITIERNRNNRLRLANVANARSFTLQFKNTDLSLLALDGQPVPMRALGPESITLAPGQRVDLLLVNPLDQVIISIDLFEDVVESSFLLASGQTPPPLPDRFSLPANPLTPVGEVSEARVVPVVIAGGAKGGLKSARVGEEEMELRAMLERGLAWAINGVAGTGGPMLMDARKGETLILDVVNQTNFSQPLHIHGHVWKVIEQDGQPVADAPWRDTHVVVAQGKAKLLMVADNPGQWALQSLVAERLDAGLIAGFTVSDMP